jgi:ribosomal protein S18 acetylase RimI-like enzyme
MVKAAEASLKFRDGAPDDALQISDLGRQTYSEYFGHVYKKSDLDIYLDRYFSVDRVRRDLEDPEIEYRIALSSSNMVGYAKIGPTTLPLGRDAENALELHRLYVREFRQGVGVGGILLSWAIDRARERGANELCLGVWTNSTNAIKMYESRGFESEDEYEISIGSAKDYERIMSLKLKEKIKA